MINWRKINNYLRINEDELTLEITASYLSLDMISFIKKYMKTNFIEGLSYGDIFMEKCDISFLEEFVNLKRLGLSCSGFEFKPINKLVFLEEISISFHFDGEIDFSKFSNLRKVHINWDNEGVESLLKCRQLTEISIMNYSRLTLSDFQNWEGLESLYLYDPKSISLEGIGQLKNLINLKINGAKNLKDLGDIEELQKLEHFTLHGAKKLEVFTPITYLRNLKVLNLDTLGSIPSIKFVESLHNLEEFYMTESTNVEDGNLSVLDYLRKNHKLKKVGFANRKHYSHTREQLGYQVPPEVAAIFMKKKK